MGENTQTFDYDQRTKKMLDNYAKNYKIFIDTCTLIHPGINKFWDNLIPFLEKYNNKVIIPSQAYEEIVKHTHNPELESRAKASLKKINELYKAGFISFKGEETDNFADNVFQVVFIKFRMTNKLVLITQDKKLGKDILNLNKINSVKANNVNVWQIDHDGCLRNINDFIPEDPRDDKKKVRSKEQNEKKKKNDIITDKFNMCKEVTSVPNEVAAVSSIPGLDGGSEPVAFTSLGKQVALTAQIAVGNEGIVYSTDTPFVAKIYKNEHLTKRQQEKLKLMLEKKLECDGI